MFNAEDAATEAEQQLVVTESMRLAGELLLASGDETAIDAVIDAFPKRIPDEDLSSEIFIAATETIVLQVIPRLVVTRRERARLEQIAAYLVENAAARS